MESASLAVKDDMYTIETKNNFLRLAIEKSNNLDRCSEICIIDLTSMSSLTEIIAIIEKNGMSSLFIFIGGTCLYSRLMQSFIEIELTMPMEKTLEKLDVSHGMTYALAMKRLIEYKAMIGMTHKEKVTVYSLLLNDSIIRAARYSVICPKTFYHRLNVLAKKMNMPSLLAHFFFVESIHLLT